MRELLGRFLSWRVGLWWWAFVLFFPVIPAVATLYLYHLFGGPAVDWSQLKPLYSIVPTFIILTTAAGMGEEFSWRGFALPRLQARYNALTASLIVGVCWSLWHIPLFLTKGAIQYEWRLQAGLLLPILAYSAFVISESIRCTWVFNNTKGSVLLVALQHGALNAWNGYINVYRGHFGGILTYMAVLVVISILIALWAGATNLSRTTERNVLLSEDDLPVRAATTPIAI